MKGRRSNKRDDKQEKRPGSRPGRQANTRSRSRSRSEEPSRPRKTEEAPMETQAETIRLNRYIANSGVCSRREADKLIARGLVTVNGQVVTEMGQQVKRNDEVRFEDRKSTRLNSSHVRIS